MVQIIVAFLVCIFATTIGALTGLGGGVIIKPVMDSVATTMSTVEVSFLSSCTVLAMAVSSCIKSRATIATIERKTLILPAVGAATGGVVGNFLFAFAVSGFSNPGMIKIIQNSVLVTLIVGIIIYMKNEDRITTLTLQGNAAKLSVGLVLGVSAAFLGIGGGPINLIALYFFFSMKPKMAACCSVFIILFSQTFNITTTIIKGAPEIDPIMMIFMVIGGVAGGFIGSAIADHVDDDKTKKIFFYALIGVALISCYNIVSTLM